MMLLQVAAETAGITAQTWFITGLGFGMVVALLALFVYVMKLLGWIMQPRVKAKKVENVAAEQTVTHTHSKLDDSITLTADSTAAIALALHLYYNGVHDEEDTKITIQPHRTQWNN
ncbi:MAG: OadG family protein, partial [Paludibacteraceae bacterium]|nr:OadG family protein [Paludibacteraceae bacterium]